MTAPPTPTASPSSDQPVLTAERLPAISPLIAAGSRFPVGTGNPDGTTALGPVELRTFLLRGAESHDHAAPRRGGTPKATTQADGTRDDSSEEFNQPDFSP